MGRSPELFNSGYDEYVKIIYSGYYKYFKNINSGYYEWLSRAREYVSSAESVLLGVWCMRVVHDGSAREYLSGAQDYRVGTSGTRDRSTRVRSGAQVVHVHEWCTRVCSGARVVHKIMEWCTSAEWCTRTSGARVVVVHQNGERVGVVHEIAARAQVVYEMGA